MVAWRWIVWRTCFTGAGVERKQLQQGTKEKLMALMAQLKVCSKTKNLQRGKNIHAQAIETGNGSSVYVASALVHMYAKCGSMVNARVVFDSVKCPNVVLWTALIMGYAENGDGFTALDQFARMKSRGCAPNSITFIASLKACISCAMTQEKSRKAECLEWGRQIHSEIGCHSSTYVQNTLIGMYSKCGSMIDAFKVFNSMERPDVVSWTALILGYAENGESITALDMLAMMRYQGCQPDCITYVAALKACASLAQDEDKTQCLERGKQIHLDARGYSDLYVQNSLIDMYAKCGSMKDAQQVFDSMKHRDLVSWNALILGYAENGDGGGALDLFARMRSQACTPDHITFYAALKACGFLGDLELGRKLHAEIRTRAQLNAALVTCLVDFYANCGSLADAQQVFDVHPETRDLTTWNALMGGYSRSGDNEAVLELFQRMQDEGNAPDGLTLLCVLMSCSHAGLVDKATHFFGAMCTKYGIARNLEHYNSMADILGRSNRLEDCMALLRSMPFAPNVVTWMTLLGACRKWKNAWIGRLAFLSLDGTNAYAHVLMADIYRSRSMRNEQKRCEASLRLPKSWAELKRPCMQGS